MFRSHSRLGPLVVIVLACAIMLTNLPAAAWDSIVPYANSHYLWVSDAIAELRDESAIYSELDAETIAKGAQSEEAHPQRRNLTDPSLPAWYQYSVGNNPGNTHPEYYWQTALYYYRQYVASGKTNNSYRDQAYHYLGVLMHQLGDSSAPPHAYNVMHGAAYLPDPRSQDLIEYLSQVVALQVATYAPPFFGRYPYDYYLRPNSAFYPGKNVLDVSNHRDDSFQEKWLRPGVTTWSSVLDTNLQAPAARRVRVETYSPDGWPVFHLRFTYYAWRSGVQQLVTHESGEMCAAHTCQPPRTHEWTDTFVANTPLKVEYRRPETGSLVFERLVRFWIYVDETDDVRNGLRDPGYTNPWEYLDWLSAWTVSQATAAPFWRRYWRTDGEYGDLRFDVVWETAPNSERALLSMLAQATKQTAKWTLRAAFEQFKALENDAVSISDQDAIGPYTYRVALYADPKYNSDTHTGLGGGTPDYIRSYSVACTPYLNRPCNERQFTIDGPLSWLSGSISSVAVRNATVRLYRADGTFRDLTADAATLGDFDNAVTAVRITPTHQTLPPSDQLDLNLLVNPRADDGAGSGDGGLIVEIPGWRPAGGDLAAATVVQYGAPGFPDGEGVGQSKPNFFAGGPDRYRSGLRQDVSVAELAPLIDAGQLGFTLTGYFGGKDAQDDRARLTASFMPNLTTEERSATIGEVTAAERDNATGLLQRIRSGFVPAGTRTIGLLLDFGRECQACSDDNHAYADGLSLVLETRANTAPTISPVDKLEGNVADTLAFEFRAADAEDGPVRVTMHSSNQAVIHDGWIVLNRAEEDPGRWICTILPERTGATRLGVGRAVLTITATDTAGLRAEQYVIVEVTRKAYLPLSSR